MTFERGAPAYCTQARFRIRFSAYKNKFEKGVCTDFIAVKNVFM